MQEDLKENIQNFEGFFQQITKLLSKKSWFKKDKWITQSHLFEMKGKPEAVSYHIFKKHWFNDERQGIHFETARDLRPGKDREVIVTLHIFHTAKIPGTNLKREAVSKPIIDNIDKSLKSLKGYKFRKGKYGTQYFSKAFKSSEKDLPLIVASEFEILCTTFGPEIDKVLKEIVP